MRKTLLFLSLLLMADVLPARNKVFLEPAYASNGSQSTGYRPVRIEMNKDHTWLHVAITPRYGWTLSAKTRLAAGDKVFPLEEAVVYQHAIDGSLKPAEQVVFDQAYKTARYDSLVLRFGALPGNVKVCDLVSEQWNELNMAGIRFDGKDYPLLMPAQKTPALHAPDEPLQPFKLKPGRAVTSIKVYEADGKSREIGFFGMTNPLTNKNDGNIGWDSVAQSNRIVVEGALPRKAYSIGYQLPGVEQFLTQIDFLMLPGAETTLEIDKAACHRANVSNPKRRTTTAQCYRFSGELGDLNEVLAHDFFSRYSGGYNKVWKEGMTQQQCADSLWAHFGRQKQRIEGTSYTRRQKDFLILRNEKNYATQRMRLHTEQNMPLTDAHAAELAICKDGRAYYVLESADLLPYMEANGLRGEVYDWMKNLVYAGRIADSIQNQKIQSDAVIASIAEPYREMLRAYNQETKEQVAKLKAMAGERIRPIPEADGMEMLQEMVAPHKGKVVFFDFWATWCGPCMRGIKGMEPMKKEYQGKDVVFIYVTDESSPLDKWSNEVVNTPGLHYRLPKRKEQSIPNFSAIPRYMIFDKSGKQVFDEVGYDENRLTQFREIIDKALAE